MAVLVPTPCIIMASVVSAMSPVFTPASFIFGAPILPIMSSVSGGSVNHPGLYWIRVIIVYIGIDRRGNIMVMSYST